MAVTVPRLNPCPASGDEDEDRGLCEGVCVSALAGGVGGEPGGRERASEGLAD